MKKILRYILFILLFLIGAAAIAWFGFLKPAPPPISEFDRQQIEIMPLPAKLKLKGGELQLKGLFEPVIEAPDVPYIQMMLDLFKERYVKMVPDVDWQETGNKIHIRVNEIREKYPSIEDDESYALKINHKGIHIDAINQTGLLYALESLMQLTYIKEGQVFVPFVKIEDEPRFPYRGLMLDLCRHWVPKDVVLRTIDGMLASKLNVLHLHLTEYQGFRIESKVFPGLHEQGSDGKYLSREEMSEIIEYAAQRGIRVIPEFDLPGHSTSWLVAYPELGSAPGPYSIANNYGILEPVMDPTKESVYDFLDKFFGEMAGLFPDPVMHIGGDEVLDRHWNENQDIQAFMAEKGLEDSHALQAYFNERLQLILEKYGKIMMGWDEILHPALPEEGIIIQTWRNHKSLWQGAREGYKGVLSAGYYLDHKQSAAFHYAVDPMIIPGAVDIEIDSNIWKSWDLEIEVREMVMDGKLFLFGEGEETRGVLEMMEQAASFKEVEFQNGEMKFSYESPFGTLNYKLREEGDSLSGEAKIAVFNLDIRGARSGRNDMSGSVLPEFDKIEPLRPEQKKHIIGGEACMWSEMVGEQTIESRTWPRAAVVAEKLWSPQELTNDNEDMYRRLISFDVKLENLGVEHRENFEKIYGKSFTGEERSVLESLLEIVQEDVLFNRMLIYSPELYTYTPLDRPVDAAPAESYESYKFKLMVNEWLENNDEGLALELSTQIKEWISVYDLLNPLIRKDARLKDLERHAYYLSELSKRAIQVLDRSQEFSDEGLDSLYIHSQKASGGMVLPVASDLQRIIESSSMVKG